MIPSRYRIFDTRITDKDAQRLGIYLGCWGKLNKLFLQGVNDSDLKRLIMLELAGAQRRPILDRLQMRLCRLERRRLAELVESRL